MIRNITKSIIRVPAVLSTLAIKVYQQLFSPDHSWLKHRYPYGYCRHFPTCSEYTKQAILKFGFARGIWLSVNRVLKCNPWTQPKVDLVPNR